VSNSDIVTIEFLFYKIGQWNNNDKLIVGINTVDLELGSFAQQDPLNFDNTLNSFYSGAAGGISWKRYSTIESSALGIHTTLDQIHTVEIAIPSNYFALGSFHLKLSVNLSDSNGSAGFDDIRIMAMKYSCNSPKDSLINPPSDMNNIPDAALPVTCKGDAASLSFDVSTFDGLDYSCSAEGEFILTRSTPKSGSSGFEMQGRLWNYGSDNKVSLPRGLVVLDDGTPKVQISVAQDSGKNDLVAGQCPMDVYVNNQRYSLNAAASLGDFAGVRIERIGAIGHESIIAYYPDTGVQVTAMIKQSSWFGCYLSIKLCLPDSYREGEEFMGLFGSRDGDKQTEWMKNNGDLIKFKTAARHFEPAYDYCTSNWCLRNEKESMFSYSEDMSFEDYQAGCEKKFNNKVANCMRNPTAELKATCGSTLSCLNAGCAGRIEDARDAIAIENHLLEQQCGDLITFEDFDDGNRKDLSGWEEIGLGELVPASRDTNNIIGNNQFMGRLSKSRPVIMKTYVVPKTIGKTSLSVWCLKGPSYT